MTTRTRTSTSTTTGVTTGSTGRRSTANGHTVADAAAPGSPAALSSKLPGLRMRPQRPIRALLGALLVVGSVVAAITIYTSLGDRVKVLAATRTILAGEPIDAADLRIVAISTDDELATISATERSVVIGQYARVRIAAGALVVDEAIQTAPLVDPDRVLMAIQVSAGSVPVGLREQSRVVLIVERSTSVTNDTPPRLVEATVVSVPADLAGRVAGAGPNDVVALSVEVPPDAAAAIGTAEEISIGVLDPTIELSALTVDEIDPAAGESAADEEASR